MRKRFGRMESIKDVNGNARAPHKFSVTAGVNPITKVVNFDNLYP
ncbi:hypothetical protein CLV41_10442 [Roseibium marinum]|uniref:Uncharacterized protein n=1 Tax=Roseibium marinum TaxID=281252 RepID=A0A2S3UV92_9HYPH|nr:hypothetical protein CLV41_10442 [Roseibium marinum]